MRTDKETIAYRPLRWRCRCDICFASLLVDHVDSISHFFNLSSSVVPESRSPAVPLLSGLRKNVPAKGGRYTSVIHRIKPKRVICHM